MVYTVTFNPSLDYVVRLKDYVPGKVNRTCGEDIFPGGKGINVSVVLKNLGIDSTALGFIAGFTGDEIERYVTGYGCNSEFIKVEGGFSRINIKVKTDVESEINGQGPIITDEDIKKMYQKLDNLKDGDILVMAGSTGDSLSSSIYSDIMEYLKDKDIKIVVDATGELLKNVLKFKPFLIKPNNHEMEEVFGVTIDTEEKLIEYGRKLREMGARNVLISRAGDGAILIDEFDHIYSNVPPKGKVINSVGAGDSMVAGFVAGYLEKESYEFALKMGLCTGSATAFSQGLATKEKVMMLMGN